MVSIDTEFKPLGEDNDRYVFYPKGDHLPPKTLRITLEKTKQIKRDRRYALLSNLADKLIRKADTESSLRLRTKVPLMIGVVTIASSLGLAVSSYQIGADAIEVSQKQLVTTTQDLILSLLQDTNVKSMAHADLISRLPFVEDNLTKKSKDALLNALRPALDVQKQKFAITEAQFHLPPATSILRIFKPEAPQEDLSSFRQMVLKVNKEHIPLSGIEVGRRGVGIRGVAPIQNQGVHIGSFEIAMEFKPVLDNLKRISGYESAVFVDEEKMSKIATLIPKPDPEKIIGSMRVQEATNWRLIRGLTTPDIIDSTNQMDAYQKKYDGDTYSMILVPLLDFKGEQIGLIVATKSLKYIENLRSSLLWNNAFLAMGQALTVTALASVLFNGLLLRPILALGTGIRAMLEDGDTKDSASASLDELSTRRDEVGAIARDCKDLQQFITRKNDGSDITSVIR